MVTGKTLWPPISVRKITPWLELQLEPVSLLDYGMEKNQIAYLVGINWVVSGENLFSVSGQALLKRACLAAENR